jgi:hypothetical protein
MLSVEICRKNGIEDIAIKQTKNLYSSSNSLVAFISTMQAQDGVRGLPFRLSPW